MWLMSTSGDDVIEDVLLEAKALWLSKDTVPWGSLYKQLKDAAKQVNDYKDSESVKGKVAVCFTRPYWNAKDSIENADQRELWLREDPPSCEKYDYCAHYWLNDEHMRYCKFESEIYPALLIYCKEL